MGYSKLQKDLLKKLPKVDELMLTIEADVPHGVKLRACREVVSSLRSEIFKKADPDPHLLDHDVVASNLQKKLAEFLEPSLRPLVNATGVVIHTNLGRSLLPQEVFSSLVEVGGRYSNLEYNLKEGVRGSRYTHVEDLLCELTGAEAALVVNNNAAAVLITLETLAKGKEVVVSRGELVEIGGSFRIPDVMARSGARLKEVGATNRTHLKDYEAAICEDTALLMKVHQSNFQLVGFTKSVSVRELSALGRRYSLPVYEDLGSGNFIDFKRYSMINEPTVQESIAAGADLVSFSGDKLLGGPQAGIIVGKRDLVERIKKNPLNRAVRIDKLTLAALQGVLHLYRDPEKAVQKIPTLRMLVMDPASLKSRARRLARKIKRLSIPGLEVSVGETISRVGGGALPLEELRSAAVFLRLRDYSSSKLEAILRGNKPPVIVRIENERILMDVRTIQDGDEKIILDSIKKACARLGR